VRIDGDDRFDSITFKNLKHPLSMLFKSVVNTFIMHKRPRVHLIFIKISEIDFGRLEQQRDIAQDIVVLHCFFRVGSSHEPRQVDKLVSEPSQTKEICDPGVFEKRHFGGQS